MSNNSPLDLLDLHECRCCATMWDTEDRARECERDDKADGQS